jgi:hypothetical protein
MQPSYARRRAAALLLWPTLPVAVRAVLAIGFPSPAAAKLCDYESAREPEIINLRAQHLRCFKARQVVNAVADYMSGTGRFPAFVRVGIEGRKFRCVGDALGRTDFGEVQPSSCRRGDKVVQFQVVLSRVDP